MASRRDWIIAQSVHIFPQSVGCYIFTPLNLVALHNGILTALRGPVAASIGTEV